MATYLLVKSGPEAGRQFPLDPNRPMHIGRGDSCEVMLTDPVSSRFHAVVYFEDGNWQLRDTGSRNGTLVNKQKTDHAMLLDQTLITVGSTDIMLVEPTGESVSDSNSQTIVLDRSMASAEAIEESFSSLQALRDNVFVSQLIDLYSLSLQLFGSDSADDVIELCLELIRSRTDADVIGFSVDGGDGRLVPQRLSPAEAGTTIRLDRRLSKRVLRDGEAIWVKQAEDAEKDQRDWLDAIFVPLKHRDMTIGVLHIYRVYAQFTADHFDLAINAGRLLGAAVSGANQTSNLKAANKRSADRNAETGEIVGNSAPIRRLKEKIARVGRANGSVLIRGESGVGKELVAHGLHRASPRAERPLLTVNCAAIPRDLVESQLFGHKKGSFTGADTDHIGWFQQAHTGTLFLDEVGELTLEAQAKLLRILEGHPFLPVGGTQQVWVDVRVIAATNRDLAEFVRERRFREDLFYRLSVFELHVPPLREREEDIDLLIQHFFDHFRVEHHRPKLELSKSARDRLLRYAWPGNVRQLRNVIDSACVMADDPEILPTDLGLHDAGLDDLDTLRIDQWERRLIHKALERAGGSVPEAAELLGISRATAYRKIAEYDIVR